MDWREVDEDKEESLATSLEHSKLDAILPSVNAPLCILLLFRVLFVEKGTKTNCVALLQLSSYLFTKERCSAPETCHSHYCVIGVIEKMFC